MVSFSTHVSEALLVLLQFCITLLKKIYI